MRRFLPTILLMICFACSSGGGASFAVTGAGLTGRPTGLTTALDVAGGEEVVIRGVGFEDGLSHPPLAFEKLLVDEVRLRPVYGGPTLGTPKHECHRKQHREEERSVHRPTHRSKPQVARDAELALKVDQLEEERLEIALAPV